MFAARGGFLTPQTQLTPIGPPSTVITSSSINVCVPTAGAVNVTNDVAWYRLTLGSFTPFINFETSGSEDTEIGLYDSVGNLIDDDDDGGPGLLSLLEITDLAAGTYYIAVGLYNTEFGPSNWEVTGGDPLTDDCSLQLSVSTTPPPGIMTLTFDTSLNSNAPVFIPFGNGTGNVTINWSDGVIETGITATGLVSHQYPYAGTWNVVVTGNFTKLYNGGLIPMPALTEINLWDNNLGITSLQYAFIGATNLFSVPSNLPSGVTNLDRMLLNCSSFNSNNITFWDVSNVTDMQYMFLNAIAFNRNIGSWNTSNVTNMNGLFGNASLFNQDISMWDVSNVTSMNEMFYGTPQFNQDLSGWCVTNIPTLPTDFATNSALSPSNYPIWGTCP